MRLESVEHLGPGDVLHLELRLDPLLDAPNFLRQTTKGVEMRIRIPFPRQAVRDLARLGLFVGGGDGGDLPGKDRQPSGKIRLCCPKCVWTWEGLRAVPQRHRPKCPKHNLAKKC